MHPTGSDTDETYTHCHPHAADTTCKAVRAAAAGELVAWLRGVDAMCTADGEGAATGVNNASKPKTRFLTSPADVGAGRSSLNPDCVL